MKKFFAILLAGVLTVGLAACGGSDDAATNDDSNKEEITLKIGASPTPHAEILNAAKDELAEKGIKLDIVEFTDYVQPNLATESGDLDANYFQHTPYLEQFNKEQGTHLVAVGKVHFEPMSIYAGTVKDLKDIPAGTKVGIPNDATNGGRALLLLEANGLIKLNPDAESVADKTYGNVVVVKEGNENLPGIAELMEVLHGQTVVDFINNTYGGAVAPLQ